MELKYRIRELRESMGLSGEELGRKVGCSKSAIGNYEQGTRIPKPEILEALADVFNVDMDYLMGRSNIKRKIFFDQYGNEHHCLIDDNIDIEDINNIPSIFSQNQFMSEQYLYNIMGRNNLQDRASSIDNNKNKLKHNENIGVKINVLGRVAAGIPINAIEEIIDTEEISEELAKTGEFFGLQIHGDSMEPRICEGDVVIVRQQSDAESGDIVIALVNGDDATCKRLRKYRDGIELISNNPSYEPMFFSEKDIIDKPVQIIGKVVELRGKF